MAHNPSHIIRRGGSFFYNRRVPQKAQEGFGSQFARVALGRDERLSRELSERLGSKLGVPGEGLDSKKRGTFTEDQLREAYQIALASGSEVKLLVPILGETGARLAEIVGLRLCDVDLDNQLIRITPHPARRLKTRGSERQVPLVGAALEAARQLKDRRNDTDEFLLPRYKRDGLILATHASNAVNKWLKRRYGGLTAHSLRHTMRDRLRVVNAPIDLVDQIGGWSSVKSVGVGYGAGYSQDHVKRWPSKIAIMYVGKI